MSQAELLHDGAEGEDGEVREADDDQHHADSSADEERRVGREGARGRPAPVCLRASEPASASTGTISRNRPKSIARPSVVLNQSVFPVSPPNAEPLLLDADVNA